MYDILAKDVLSVSDHGALAEEIGMENGSLEGALQAFLVEQDPEIGSWVGEWLGRGGMRKLLRRVDAEFDDRATLVQLADRWLQARGCAAPVPPARPHALVRFIEELLQQFHVVAAAPHVAAVLGPHVGTLLRLIAWYYRLPDLRRPEEIEVLSTGDLAGTVATMTDQQCPPYARTGTRSVQILEPLERDALMLAAAALKRIEAGVGRAEDAADVANSVASLLRSWRQRSAGELDQVPKGAVGRGWRDNDQMRVIDEYGDALTIARMVGDVAERDGMLLDPQACGIHEAADLLPLPEGEGWRTPYIMEGFESTTDRKRRFKVALTYPGTHREYVEKVANALSARVGREAVFYDRFRMAELARPNLDTYLQAIYGEDSELVVVFLCRDYEARNWCGLEWRSIRDLIARTDDERLMFMRFDDDRVSGAFSIDGYIDLRDVVPESAAELVLDRLGLT